MKIFGSDGFRCEFGTDFLTFNSITSFANALAEYYLLNGFKESIIINFLSLYFFLNFQVLKIISDEILFGSPAIIAMGFNIC